MIMIVLLISIFIAFLIWSNQMLKGNLNKLDKSVYDQIKINKIKTLVWKIITMFGSAKFVILLCLIFLLVLKNKQTAIIIIINMLIMWGLIGILKNIFKRKRPNINRLV